MPPFKTSAGVLGHVRDEDEEEEEEEEEEDDEEEEGVVGESRLVLNAEMISRKCGNVRITRLRNLHSVLMSSTENDFLITFSASTDPWVLT